MDLKLHESRLLLREQEFTLKSAASGLRVKLERKMSVACGTDYKSSALYFV